MANFLGEFVHHVNHVPTTLHNLGSTLSHPFRKKHHGSSSSMPSSYEPGDWDVCCGRGKRNWNHRGNIRFRNLVQSHVQLYIDSPTRQEKGHVVVKVVEHVREHGGNFLKQEKSGRWYDIGDAEARDKVGHSLRDQVTAIQRQKNNIPSFKKKLQRAGMERQSSTLSDSGNEVELRKSSNAMTSLVRASFERRPSFIMESYVSHGTSQQRASVLVSGDEATSFRMSSMRRASNWEFLDSLDDILDLVASENTSTQFIENLDLLDHQLYMDDDSPMRLSETVGTISEFSLGDSVDSKDKKTRSASLS